MIYLNHAATSYPLLPAVKQAVMESMEMLPQSQYRSTHVSNDSLEIRCKEKLGKLIQIAEYEKIVFASGATEAANLLIQGMELSGRTVLVTTDSHNCILRPLYNGKGIITKQIHCNTDGELKWEELEKAMQTGAYALFVNHCSNVTGNILDMERAAALCRKYHVLLIADIAQSAGCIPVKTDKWNADGVIFTAHKSLLGIAGLGGFYYRKPEQLRPVKFGGTGRDSRILTFSDTNKAEWEVGTQNMTAIAALDTALDYLTCDGELEKIQRKEQCMIDILRSSMLKLPHIRCFGDGKKEHGPVLSFAADGLSSADMGYILENVYQIIVRTGLHCAPLIHEDIGSGEQGTVRLSVSAMSRPEELVPCIRVLDEITSAL